MTSCCCASPGTLPLHRRRTRESPLTSHPILLCFCFCFCAQERVTAESDFSVTHQQGTGDDLLIVAEFPPGAKLGFSIEKNAVTEVKEAGGGAPFQTCFDSTRLNGGIRVITVTSCGGESKIIRVELSTRTNVIDDPGGRTRTRRRRASDVVGSSRRSTGSRWSRARRRC